VNRLARLTAPTAAKVRSTPLQFKLLAAVLALVVGALMLISVASTVALRSYLMDRIDNELNIVTAQVQQRSIGEPDFFTEYLIAQTDLVGNHPDFD